MNRSTRAWIGALLFFCGSWTLSVAGAVEERQAEIEKWRVERQDRLREEGSWLTLVGLHWLTPGENRFGADENLAVPLEAPGVPAWAGTFHLEEEGVRLEVAPGASLTRNDETFSGSTLIVDDSEGSPDVIGVGRLRMTVIRRGDKFGIRVKDPESEVRTGFAGIDYYPIDPGYRVEAQLKRFDEPLSVEIPTVVGTTATLLVPGQVEFILHGAKRVLRPLISEPGDTSLWFIFKDLTSGKETYGFRYLWADVDETGTIDLDFNYAYNPPCAFTPYATCIVPMKENRLDFPIEAGEKKFH